MNSQSINHSALRKKQPFATASMTTLYLTDPLANLQENSSSLGEYANLHIPSFLQVPPPSERSTLQVVHDGTKLTAEALKLGILNPSVPILVCDKPESLGMSIPRRRDGTVFSIRNLADVVGHKTPVVVIDVEHQEEKEGWTLGDLVEYFEDEERLLTTSRRNQSDSYSSSPGERTKRRRAAAVAAVQRTARRKATLNQISLEVSKTPLRGMIRSPQFVRDLDWIDHAWPSSRRESGDYPRVQYYCLTSTAGCYTDFHVDFGGTAVWYHVLEGEKQFVLMPPTAHYLKLYEDWLCMKDQASTFLLDLIDSNELKAQSNIFRLAVKPGQTMMIPTGWIHAVYTPNDSLVFGGNFLHGLDIAKQLAINSLETRTRVRDKFRFPRYLELQFFAAKYYLQKLRLGNVCQREVDGLKELIFGLDQWWKLRADANMVSAAEDASKNCGCKSVDEMLAQLSLERARIVRDGICRNPDHREVSKPKLKLKVSPPPKTEKKSSTVRITLSKTALLSVPSRAKRKEDLEEFIPKAHEEQEEWIPPSKKPTTGKKTRLPASFKSAEAKKTHTQAKVKKKVGSRDRLMKRFKL